MLVAGKNSGLIFQLVSMYQKYAGVGFFIVLCLEKKQIFFEKFLLTL